MTSLGMIVVLREVIPQPTKETSLTAMTDYDARVLRAVRRAVAGLTIDDWGTFAWEFNHRVKASAQLSLLDLSREEQAVLSEVPTHEMFYNVMYTVEEKTGVCDKALAHLIVAMYDTLQAEPACHI